jgi:PadR family transcriptional regulator AphA
MAVTTALGTSEAAILGLLAESGPSSGYDLMKRMRGTVALMWAPARSHTYAVLPRLEAAGCIVRHDVAGRGRPARQVYSLTDAGRAALAAWLRAPAEDLAPPRNEFLLKLVFGAHVEPATVVAHVRAYRTRMAGALAELERLEVDRESDLHGWLTLQHGLARARATLAWADETLHILEGSDP